MASNHQKDLFQKRRWRIRKKVIGTAERPRLVVTFTHHHIYAQCINDATGQTQVAVSTLSKAIKSKGLKPNIIGATALGAIMGEQAKAAGINQIVFDRAGRRFHGCVKAFAQAVRQAGLIF